MTKFSKIYSSDQSDTSFDRGHYADYINKFNKGSLGLDINEQLQ